MRTCHASFCATVQQKKITRVLDLQGMKFEDMGTIEGAEAPQLSWMRRCIAAADKKCACLHCMAMFGTWVLLHIHLRLAQAFVASSAQPSSGASAPSEASAIRTLIDTVRNEEAR